MLSQQRSDVDADKDHQQHRGTKKHRKLLANTTKDAALEVRGVAQVQIPASVAAIVLLSDEGPSQGVEFCSRGGVLNAGTLADDRLQSVVGQRVRRSVRGEIAQGRERNPGSFRNAAKDAGESGGGYTDDGERVAIDGDRAADDAGVGVETLAPESVGKDNLVLRAIGTIIGAGIECPTDLRLHAEHRKVVGGDGACGDRDRLRIGSIQVEGCEGERGGIAE